MKKATVSDLHKHFNRISKWLDAGETVQVFESGLPVARIVPKSREAKTFLGACPSLNPIPADIDDPVDVEWNAIKAESPI